MWLRERHAIFRQPLLYTEPRRADELPSCKSYVAGHLVENTVRKNEGIGFPGGMELCFGQSQALEGAFKDVDAKRRDAVANLGEHLSRELRQQTKLALAEVNSCN